MINCCNRLMMTWYYAQTSSTLIIHCCQVFVWYVSPTLIPSPNWNSNRSILNLDAFGLVFKTPRIPSGHEMMKRLWPCLLGCDCWNLHLSTCPCQHRPSFHCMLQLTLWRHLLLLDWVVLFSFQMGPQCIFNFKSHSRKLEHTGHGLEMTCRSILLHGSFWLNFV